MIQADGWRDGPFSFWKSKWTGFYLAENVLSMSGYLTDLQWFGKSLTNKEMIDMTTCKKYLKGRKQIFYTLYHQLMVESMSTQNSLNSLVL